MLEKLQIKNHSPERAIPSEKKRQQNCSFSLSYYAILLGPPFLDTIHYFLASMNHFWTTLKKQKKMNSTSKIFFPIQNPRKGRNEKINVSPAIFCFTKKTLEKKKNIKKMLLKNSRTIIQDLLIEIAKWTK